MAQDITTSKTQGKKFSQTLPTFLQKISIQCNLLKQYEHATTNHQNEILEQLQPNVREMLYEFGLIETIKRLDFAIQNDKYRPRNIPILDFAKMPDLFSVGGKFSSFDQNLSRMVKRGERTELIHDYINDNVLNISEIARNNVIALDRYMDMYPQLRDAAINAGPDGDNRAYNNFFTQVASGVFKELVPDDNTFCLRVFIIDSWHHVPDSMKKADPNIINSTAGGKTRYTISADGKKLPQADIYIVPRIVKRHVPSGNNIDFFIKMCNVFMHELGHVIDDYFPNRGMLGAQQAHIGNNSYDNSTPNAYMNNPTEQSSFIIGGVVENALKQKFGRQ